MGRRSISKSNGLKNKLSLIIKNLFRNLYAADSLEIRFTKFARAVFRNPIFGF